MQETKKYELEFTILKYRAFQNVLMVFKMELHETVSDINVILEEHSAESEIFNALNLIVLNFTNGWRSAYGLSVIENFIDIR